MVARSLSWMAALARSPLGQTVAGFPVARAVWRAAVRPAALRVWPRLVLSTMGGEELFEGRLFCEAIGRGDVVVDIGANTGYYTLLGAWAAGCAGRVIAFEPEPGNFARLEENVRAFRCSNVVLERRAVAGRTGRLDLFVSGQSSGDHRVFDPGGGRRRMEIDAVRLDDYFPPDAQVDVIKMDIQGAEMDALQGMQKLLRRNDRVRLFTEFWPHGLKTADKDPAEFLTALVDLGFAVHHVDENSGRLEPADFGRLLREYGPESRRYTNLLCVRRPETLLPSLRRGSR